MRLTGIDMNRVLLLTLAIILILLLFNLGNFWRPNKIYSFLNIEGKSFTLPETANYIPVDVDLSFHWKSNPSLVSEYFASINKKAKRPNKITGSDKQLVGVVASKIKTLRKIEPYKGKGIREKGQYILKKEGKKK